MPRRLPRRNVEVFDSHNGIVAGFWQYGTLQWGEFYRYLNEFVRTPTDWAIFSHEPNQSWLDHGALHPPGAEIVQPGSYILLSTGGEPIQVDLDRTPCRPVQPLVSNTTRRGSHYRDRVTDRDNKCLISGLEADSYKRLDAAHIFPRAHDIEWSRRGFPEMITDTADEAIIGGPLKIDSIQNLITLRSDLHRAWDNYEFGVDPSNNYRITSLRNGNGDFNGLHLQLDHIHDPTVRPLDALFNEHFTQCILKNMRGAGEQDEDDDSEHSSSKGVKIRVNNRIRKLLTLPRLESSKAFFQSLRARVPVRRRQPVPEFQQSNSSLG